ncbi:MAG TPA: S-layer homology domain-containing protein, partial [Thermomicrobiales bacterium]
MLTWQRRAIVVLCCVLLATGLPLARPVAAASFPDLPANGATATAITELAARGIVRGYDDGTFRPGTIVERRQMAATLVRALGWSGHTPARDFPDRGATDAELWTALRILADMNVVRGFPDGTVGPEQPLTRQQAISVIARAFIAAGVWSAKPAGASPFGDVAPDHQGDVALYVDAVGTPPD